MKSSNNVELAKTEMKEALESIKQKVSQELDSPNDYKEVTK